eukprot:gene5720-7115_t
MGITKEELNNTLNSIDANLPNYLPNQLWKWMYNKGIKEVNHCTNISKAIKEQLNKEIKIDAGTVHKDQISKDGTRKFLLDFGGDKVECVFIPENDRGTLCVSSQVGCTFQCTFCYTGTQKLVRNLTSAEIVSQVVTTRYLLNDFESHKLLNNLVFMGQGEPMYNYRNLSKALAVITDPEGLGISKKKITISTSGVVPLIERLGREFPGIGLAISLHAPNNKVRSEIVPINQQWPIEELIAACKSFVNISKTNNRITFEYVMLEGVNDSDQDAYDLANLIKDFPSFVNLIPFNEWPGTRYKCSSNNRIQAFATVIEKCGVKVTVRQPRGRDILAACGTLKTESVKVKKELPPPPPEVMEQTQ